MRRTRHVVLPVKSWQYIGLLIVSLACLTLGHVSRDREGRHGTLAGPELMHTAPHEVDACPNINEVSGPLSVECLSLAPTLDPIPPPTSASSRASEVSAARSRSDVTRALPRQTRERRSVPTSRSRSRSAERRVLEDSREAGRRVLSAERRLVAVNARRVNAESRRDGPTVTRRQREETVARRYSRETRDSSDTRRSVEQRDSQERRRLVRQSQPSERLRENRRLVRQPQTSERQQERARVREWATRERMLVLRDSRAAARETPGRQVSRVDNRGEDSTRERRALVDSRLRIAAARGSARTDSRVSRDRRTAVRDLEQRRRVAQTSRDNARQKLIADRRTMDAASSKARTINDESLRRNVITSNRIADRSDQHRQTRMERKADNHIERATLKNSMMHEIKMKSIATDSQYLKNMILKNNPKYEVLRQAIVMVLCTVYGASIFNRKTAVFGNWADYASRVSVW